MTQHKIGLNCIHLWQISLNPSKAITLEYYFQYLSAKEQERANRFVFEKHRRRFIFAHFALRKILSKYVNVLPENILFEILSHGKPQLTPAQNPENITFNLSHSQEHALIGICREKTIGVDIECHREREFLGIAEHVFSEQECEMLNTTSENEQIDAFFHIWTQKEAFIKAIGQGLAYPLKDFSVSATPPARLIEAKHENVADWYFQSFKPHTNAHAAIVSLNPIAHVLFFDFEY